jgi:hypothetical protein
VPAGATDGSKPPDGAYTKSSWSILAPKPNRVKVALEPMALSPREGQVEDGESNSYLVTAVATTTVEFDFVNISALALRPNEAPDRYPPAVTSADA